MSRKQFGLWSCGFVLGLVASAPAFAQITGVFDMGVLTNTLSMDAVTQSEGKRAEDLRRRGIKEGTEAALPHGGGVAVRDPRVFAYRLEPSVHKRNVDGFAEKIGKADPATGTYLRGLFAQRDPNQIAGQYAAKYGLSIYNIADVAAMYLGASWYVSRGSKADPTAAQMRGLRAQLTSAFARTPSFAKLSNTDKQTLADSLIIEAVFDAAMLEGARDKPADVKMVADSAARGARNRIHFDVTRFELTDRGFVPLR